MAGDYSACPIADLLESGALAINDGYRAKNSELADHGIPFARAGNIDGGFHFDDADCVPDETLPRVGVKVSEPGDVVFTSKGTVGRFALVRDSTPRFVYSPQLCFWRVLDSARISPRWLYYWMNSREFFLQFKGVAGQTDMAEYVSLRDQRAMRMTLPPLPEQKRIAHVLGTLDDKIELNRRMNATLEGISRAIFKSWFVDFDPVRQKAAGKQPVGMDAQTAAMFPDSFEDSEIGEVPKGWKTVALYDTATFINGAAFKEEHFCPRHEGLPVVKIAELKNGISEHTKFSARTDLDRKYMINTGTLLYSWSGSPDTSLDVFLWTLGPGLLNQHIFRIDPLSAADKRFVYYLLKHLRPTLIEIARNKQTTGLGHVTVADMRRLRVAFPSSEVLHRFDQQIEPVFEKCFLNSLQAVSLAALRDTLLPKLLSGEIRVPEAEEAVEEAIK